MLVLPLVLIGVVASQLIPQEQAVFKLDKSISEEGNSDNYVKIGDNEINIQVPIDQNDMNEVDQDENEVDQSDKVDHNDMNEVDQNGLNHINSDLCVFQPGCQISESRAKHRKYHAHQGFFKQSSPQTNDTDYDVTNDFGLFPNQTWQDVVNHVQAMNDRGKRSKLIFLQRHGEGFHNVVPRSYDPTEWHCYWRIQDNDGKKCGIEWADAELTEKGIRELEQLRGALLNQFDSGLPLPGEYYVSPLRRTLQTWQVLFLNVTDKSAVVTEMIREKYGISTESRRHNREYIAHNFHKITFEHGFAQFDPWWKSNRHEPGAHCRYRAKKFLDRVFASDETILYVVTHSGFIKSVLRIVGHRNFEIMPGQVIPVVIEQTIEKKGYKFNLGKKWEKFPGDCKRKVGENWE